MIPEGYDLLKLREVQLLQLNVMKEIHKVCVSNGINYYIIAGSLLGAVRHGGFIPWDDDIDIAMMRPDYELFKSKFDELFDTDRFFLQHYGSDQDFMPALMRLCIKNTYVDIQAQAHLKFCKNTYIDIFPLDNVPDEENLRVEQNLDLKRVDHLLGLKLYRIYPQNGFFKKLFKKLVSELLPLKILQKKRENIMKRYNFDKTRCVSSTVSKYGYMRQIMDKRIYGEPTLIDFEDTSFFAPKLYKEYLTKLYGKDYMNIPPVEKRVKPKDVYILKH